MKAERDPNTGKWLIQYRYTDWQGKKHKSTKRGFETKREAEEWLRDFLSKQSMDFNMKFKDFMELYFEDMCTRLRESTIRRKRYIFDLKITPYFGLKRMNEITAPDIRAWQNEMLKRDYSQTYLRAINNELKAVFNYAAKYYDLPHNPCVKAGTIGKSHAGEMKIWTVEEFECFVEKLMNKQQSYLAFMILFWTGMRLGELLALTIGDIDMDANTISISKSLQRLDKRDVVTEPKTPRGIRTIAVPEFLLDDIRDYIDRLYKPEKTDRLIPVTKYFLEHEIKRGIKESGVKDIHIHCLRHSNCALLASLGFTPVEIAERLGHEKVETTLNIYAHVMPERRGAIADRLDQLYKEKKK